jgi:hypothetical protein
MSPKTTPSAANASGASGAFFFWAANGTMSWAPG